MSVTSGYLMTCPYCGSPMAHSPASCPSVKAIEFYPDGTIKRIEKVTFTSPPPSAPREPK
jgi:hypothetical protein